MKKKWLVMLLVGILVLTSACGPAELKIEFLQKQEYLSGNNISLSEIEKPEETYKNPVINRFHKSVEGQMPDPFVLRYNGKYYLYPTTDTSRIQCWVSENLVDWTYVGDCTGNYLITGAWAPEVIYYNGKFYMCTSPQGKGHYILESDSPTGPFEPVTENLGCNIDGSFFIDDNGDWYFSTSGDWGIEMYKMNSPTQIDVSSKVVTELDMKAGGMASAYAEGPMLIKYGNKYYMTYTGNDYRSTGYRIDCAVGDSPLTLTKSPDNPILINTDLAKGAGIGHSSTVIGPNLDSLYLVYHSWKTSPQQREVNIAPLVLNGNHMQVLGHTVKEQQAPKMPDIYSRFDSTESLEGWNCKRASVSEKGLVISENGSIIAKNGFSGDYTAEFNFLSIQGKAGALFGYIDNKNFGAAYINTETHELEIVFTVDGVETVQKVALEASFGEKYKFDVLQQLTVKRAGNTYTFLFNNLTVWEGESELGGGAVGVSSPKGQTTVGFVGAEGNVWLSSMKEYFKPLPQDLQAITCLESSLTLVDYNGRSYVKVSQGESYNYCVNVEDVSLYDMGIHYAADEEVTFALYGNGQLITEGILPSSGGKDTVAIFRGVSLPKGMSVLTFQITGGTANVFKYEFAVHEAVEDQIIDLSVTPWFLEGKIDFENNSNNSFTAKTEGKYLFGNKNWGDYTASVKLTPKTDEIDTSFVFRASEPADSGQDGRIDLAEYFYTGYCVNIVKNGWQSAVRLIKNNYQLQVLNVKNMTLKSGESVDVKVEAYGKNIKVYINGELIIDCIDDTPILNGAIGVVKVESVVVSDMNVAK